MKHTPYYKTKHQLQGEVAFLTLQVMHLTENIQHGERPIGIEICTFAGNGVCKHGRARFKSINLRDNPDGTCNCRQLGVGGGCFFLTLDGPCDCKCHERQVGQ